MKRFIETILLLVATVAIFCIAVQRVLTIGGVENYVLLAYSAICLWLWTDELIWRLRERRNERRHTDE